MTKTRESFLTCDIKSCSPLCIAIIALTTWPTKKMFQYSYIVSIRNNEILPFKISWIVLRKLCQCTVYKHKEKVSQHLIVIQCINVSNDYVGFTNQEVLLIFNANKNNKGRRAKAWWKNAYIWIFKCFNGNVLNKCLIYLFSLLLLKGILWYWDIVIKTRHYFCRGLDYRIEFLS
jgi:hypothetical protein